MAGFSYTKNDYQSSDKYTDKEVYLGTNVMKYIGYREISQDITYTLNHEYKYTTLNTDPILDYKIISSQVKKDTKEYTFFNILTYSKSKLTETSTEEHNSTTVKVFSKYTLEKTSLSTENLYDMIKQDALNGKDYIYPVVISKNFNSRFRIYGLVILSYEHYDYSEISGYNENNNTQSIYVKGSSDMLADNLMSNGEGKGPEYESAISGKFKGYGYGYNITAEAYWDNLSIFATSYFKKLTLKNYHSEISKREEDTHKPYNIVGNDEITISNNYLIFGLKYRF
jgi:hypothetical protein